MSASRRPLHEVIALIGWLFICAGLLGIIFAPNLLLLWVVIIGFGIAGLPRAFLEWRRGRDR
jgi:cyanate permease